MKCNTNTMLKTAAAMAVAAGVVYVTVPAARALVLGSAPILIALICPISMFVMMKMMANSSSNSKSDETRAPNGASEAAQSMGVPLRGGAVEPVRESSPAFPPVGALQSVQERHAG